MSTKENKTLVRRFYAEAERHGSDMNWMDSWLTANFVAHPPGSHEPLDREAFKAMAAGYYAAFHDVCHELHQQVAEGDLVATRMTWRMRQAGEFAGVPPTGKTITLGEIALVRIVDGKIAEYWFEFDSAGLLQQLGAKPPSVATDG